MGAGISKPKKTEAAKDRPSPQPIQTGPVEVRVLLLGSGDTGKRFVHLLHLLHILHTHITSLSVFLSIRRQRH
ncbi:hypothetical protein D3C80_1947070 [compost metagenome]